MSLLIVHLTDLHLKEQVPNYKRVAQAIVDASLSPIIKINAIHVVVSGDLANWGLEKEFEFGEQFLLTIRDELAKRADVPVSIVVTAGNHDCNFSGDQSLRDIVLGTVQASPTKITEQIESQIATVLSDFYQIQERLNPSIKRSTSWLSEFIDGSYPGVRYVLIDSAVMSSKKEKMGSLYVPPPVTQSFEGRTVFVMHHPFAWLQLENAREIDAHASQTGDLFLMGHEHLISAQRVTDLYNESSVAYLKGHVFSDHGEGRVSAFQTIQLDVDEGFSVRAYQFDGAGYAEWAEKTVLDTQSWPIRRMGRRISLSKSGYATLTAPGANYSHRKKASVTLPEIFVWPNLKAMKFEKDTGNPLGDGLIVSSESLLDRNSGSEKIVVIKGGEQYGKSALAKMLALQVCKKGVHPLLLNATEVSSWRDKGLNSRLDDAIAEFYGSSAHEDYRRLSPEERVLLLDGFDLGQVSSGYFDGLRVLSQHFGSVYLMLDSHPGMELALNEFLNDERLYDAAVFELLPTTYQQRLELIERWLVLGDDGDLKDEDLRTASAKLSKQVDETLSRNLIPAVPMFILVVIQNLELSQDVNTVLKNGSQGFLYESLITRAIADSVSICSVVTSLTYLSELAAWMTASGVDHLSQVEYESFHVEHCGRYALEISVAKLQRQFISAGIMDDRDGKVRFKYVFHLYYFIARHLAYKESWVKVEASVDEMVESIYTERSANVLLFLAHLSRDERIAKKIMDRAVAMFDAYGEVDLFDRDGPAQKFRLPEIRQILVRGSRAQELEAHQEDEREAEKAVREFNSMADKRMKERLADALSLNAAFKTLQVLGQVLRNHSGEIERDHKEQMAEACVGLGLRALGFLHELASEHGSEMIEYRGMQLRSESPQMSDLELANDLQTYLPSFISSLTVGTFIKIATAIGSEELERVLDSVLSSSKTRELLHVVTHLEHFSVFPDEALVRYKEGVLQDADFVATSVLRRFVVRRFLLYPSRDELKRAVLQRFGIASRPFMMMDQRKIPKH